MSSISTALNTNDIKVGNLVQYFNDYTQKWHDMVIVSMHAPRGKQLYADQDMRRWIVVMTYIEDPQNTKMYFHRKDMLKSEKHLFRKLEV